MRWTAENRKCRLGWKKVFVLCSCDTYLCRKLLHNFVDRPSDFATVWDVTKIDLSYWFNITVNVALTSKVSYMLEYGERELEDGR